MPQRRAELRVEVQSVAVGHASASANPELFPSRYDDSPRAARVMATSTRRAASRDSTGSGKAMRVPFIPAVVRARMTKPRRVAGDHRCFLGVEVAEVAGDLAQGVGVVGVHVFDDSGGVVEERIGRGPRHLDTRRVEHRQTILGVSRLVSQFLEAARELRLLIRQPPRCPTTRKPPRCGA
jgi:hypothetical protein